MSIFICWSEERSQLLATALRDHLPNFVPGIGKLFMSTNIDKGTRWFDEVDRELESADAGLVCLTREALQSGWIHFEAGALARAVRKRHGRLYTYLLGVEPAELKGPLAEFQSTRFDREDTRKLCAAIVASMGKNAPRRDRWEENFDRHWLAFETQVKAISPLPASKLIPGLEDIFRRKTFNEPIEECTRQSWIDRFTGARETIAGLKAYAPIMKTDNSYLLDLYNELIEELDGYAMNMGALLLTETRFDLDAEDGKLKIGNGIKRACETRRGRIRQIVGHLLARNCAPVLEMESRQYAKMSSFDAKKNILIHPAEMDIQKTWNEKKKSTSRATAEQLSECPTSLWEFDRIYYYLVQERAGSPDVDQLVESLEQELEKLRAVDGGTSLIPLHYAMRALKKRFPHGDTRLAAKVALLLTAIEKFLDKYGLDAGGQVRDNIAEFRAILSGNGGKRARHAAPASRRRTRARG